MVIYLSFILRAAEVSFHFCQAFIVLTSDDTQHPKQMAVLFFTSAHRAQSAWIQARRRNGIFLLFFPLSFSFLLYYCVFYAIILL